MYCAIIADIINSKSIKERKAFQESLEKILFAINKEYEIYIASEFMITLGDEFQGLLSSPDKLIEITDKIKLKLFPVNLRIGVGIGTIETDIKRSLPIGADGPAYYNARYALSSIKEKKNKYQQPSHGIVLSSGKLKDHFSDDLINSIFVLCNSLENSWTNKQRDLVLSQLHNEKTQREIAKELDLNQSSVQRRLKAASYYAYKYAKDMAQNSLNEKWGKI